MSATSAPSWPVFEVSGPLSGELWLEVLAVAAVGLALTRAGAQLLRVVRTGSVDGVSIAGAGSTAVTAGGWTLWGVHEHVPTVQFASGCVTALSIALTVLLVVGGRPVGRLWTPALWAGALLVLGALAGWTAVGLALALGPAFSNIPQIAVLVRERTADGVSTVAWALNLAEAAVWVGIGLPDRNPVLLGWALLHGTTSAVVLTLVRRRHGVPHPNPVPAPASSPADAYRFGTDLPDGASLDGVPA